MLMLTPREKTAAFAGVLMVLFLSSLNLTVVGTAMPRVIAELGGLEYYTWAFIGYALTTTLAILISGALSDLYGRRAIMLVGIVLFAVGSVLLGLSRSMLELVLFRAFQGLGGGAIMSMSFASIGDIFTPLERGRYQGYTGGVYGISSVIGPVVGGLLTDHAGWRWVFFVNLPFAAAAYYAIHRYLPRYRTPNGRAAVDYPGALLITAGVVPLLLGLTWAGTTYPWLSWQTLALVGGGLFLLVLFVAWELRTPQPLLDLALFRNPTFTVANIAGFFGMAGMYAAIIYLPLYMQGVKEGSASSSGMVLAPLMLGLITTSTLAGIRVSRIGRYKRYIVAGSAFTVGALCLTALLDASSPAWLALVFMMLLGFGLGPINSLLMLAVQSSSPRERLGMATSANQFFRQIGATVTLAVFGSLMTSYLNHELVRNLPAAAQKLPAGMLHQLASPKILNSPAALESTRETLTRMGGAPFADAVVHGVRVTLAGALQELFWVAAGLSLLTFLVVTRLPSVELRELHSSAPPPSAPVEHPVQI